MTQRRISNLVAIGWLSGKDQKANLLAFAGFAIVNNSLNVKNTLRNLVTEIQAIVCQPLAYDQTCMQPQILTETLFSFLSVTFMKAY